MPFFSAVVTHLIALKTLKSQKRGGGAFSLDPPFQSDLVSRGGIPLKILLKGRRLKVFCRIFQGSLENKLIFIVHF